MTTAVLENVNAFSHLGLRRRPTYDEIIGLIKENETLTGKLPNRDATFFKASNEGSFFDGLDHLEILKEQQHRILQRQMQDLLLRQNVRANGGTFHLQRHLQSSSSSGTTTPEVQADNGGMVSTQIQAELEARARRETSRQQALFETHRDEVQRQGFVPTIQSFLSGITTPIRTRTRRSSESREHSRPTPIDLSREEEEAEEEYFPEMMTAREEQEQQQEERPKKKTKLMKDISYSTNISRWKEEELEFQLFIRGTDPRDPEVSLEGLRKKGRGKGITNWQHLNNLAQEMINDGRWERRVEQELLKKRISEYKKKQQPRGSRD